MNKPKPSLPGWQPAYHTNILSLHNNPTRLLKTYTTHQHIIFQACGLMSPAFCFLSNANFRREREEKRERRRREGEDVFRIPTGGLTEPPSGKAVC